MKWWNANLVVLFGWQRCAALLHFAAMSLLSGLLLQVLVIWWCLPLTVFASVTQPLKSLVHKLSLELHQRRNSYMLDSPPPNISISDLPNYSETTKSPVTVSFSDHIRISIIMMIMVMTTTMTTMALMNMLLLMLGMLCLLFHKHMLLTQMIVSVF